MASDYVNKPEKKRRAAVRTRKRSCPVSLATRRWPWLFGGFLAGILTMASIQNWDNPASDLSQALDDITGAKLTDHVKPRFDFYTLLPQSEVVVEETEQSPLRGSGNADEIYLLQAGSFRSSRDADSLRARLLLLNLNARIEATTTEPSGTWHRVVVGPFESASKLAGARATLLQNGIDNMVLKRKTNG